MITAVEDENHSGGLAAAVRLNEVALEQRGGGLQACGDIGAAP